MSSGVKTYRVRGQFDPGLDLITTQEVVLARDYAALEAELAQMRAGQEPVATISWTNDDPEWKLKMLAEPAHCGGWQDMAPIHLRIPVPGRSVRRLPACPVYGARSGTSVRHEGWC